MAKERFNMEDHMKANPKLYTKLHIDWDAHYRQEKERKEQEQERKRQEKEAEEKRIAAIQCPVCQSTEKHHHTKYKGNGVIGPGSRSWLVEEYLICLSCGVHYSDLAKIKKK